MSVKTVEIPELGTVKLQKRKNSRSLRISISGNGMVRVSLPRWASFRMAEDFVRSKIDWVQKHRPEIQHLRDGDRVGKAHRLSFVPSKQGTIPRATTKDNLITVSVPVNMQIEDDQVQRAAHRAVVRVLKGEASRLLPARLTMLADKHGFDYGDVTVKRLATRWGSCDHQGNITLNCYLMLLPWDLIDYVLLHELTHTRIMAHGPKFWAEMAQYIPDLAEIRKRIRAQRATLNF